MSDTKEQRVQAEAPAEPMAPNPVAETHLEPVTEPVHTASMIRITNNTKHSLAIMVDNLPPERVALRPGESVDVPVDFWEAWQAKYADADFAAHVSGTPVG